MTFRDYIKTLNKYYNGAQADLVINLFDVAGAIKEVEIETAKSWLKPDGSAGHRKCRVRDFFPEEEIDENNFIEFLKRQVNTSWKELQKTFRSKNDDGLVAVDTDQQEIFYRSLLNQFKKILEIPLNEYEQNRDILPDSKSSKIGAQLAIPQECRICLYCKNWRGDIQEAYENNIDVCGKCVKDNKSKQATESSCGDFEGNTGLMTKSILERSFQFLRKF